MHKRGDIEQGFKDADVVVESKYTTQVQVHNALETHGVVADWKPDLLTVWASTQGTASVREGLAEFFKLPKSQVRVITEFMGGGFGAKFGPGNPGVVAAALSKQTGAPVRLMLDRKEEQLSVGNRPSSDQTLKIGAKKDGTLTAIQLISFGTAGCGTGAGCAGPASNLISVGILAYRRKRRLHQCRACGGISCTGASPGSLRAGTNHRRNGGKTEHGAAGVPRED